jgi:hypothetical protein
MKARLDAKIVEHHPWVGGSRARPLDPRSRVPRVEDRMLGALRMREGRKWKEVDQAGSKTPSISRTCGCDYFPVLHRALPDLCPRRVVGARCNSTIYLVLIEREVRHRLRRTDPVAADLRAPSRIFWPASPLLRVVAFNTAAGWSRDCCGGHRSRAGLAGFVEDWGAWGQGRFRRSPSVARTDSLVDWRAAYLRP